MQSVGKPPVEPRLSSGVVTAAFDRFIKHVSVVAAEPLDFLHEPVVRLRHEIGVALIPQLIAMAKRP